MRNKSLTRTLFFRVAPTILATIILIGAMAFKSATSQIQQAYDAQLISSANMLWLAVEDDLIDSDDDAFRRIRKIDLNAGNQTLLNQSATEYADDRMFRVWKGKRLVMISDGALGTVVPRQKPGFSTIKNKDQRWRIYNLPIADTNFAIEAGEKIVLRRTLVHNILFDLATPLLLLVPLIGVLIWLGIGAGLGTIRALIEQIRHRSPDDLSPLTLGDVPRDLTPLGISINHLFTKLSHSIMAERRFAEHAAHHLRTPLAALKLQLQLLTNISNASARDSLLNDLTASVDRASNLVGQLLTSTRISHQPIARTELSWRQMCLNIIEELAPVAAQKNIALSLDAEGDFPVLADETLLRLITGNVIENAIKYTPENGKVAIALEEDNEMQCCRVTDTGPGIPAEERPLVFERFYRVGTPKAQGTGLGLAIVAESIARLSGKIHLLSAPDLPGLMVEILLPKP